MNSSPARQSLADSASALRWAAANFSAANGSSSLCALTSSRVSDALRQTDLTAEPGETVCGSGSVARAAPIMARLKTAARLTMAGAPMTRSVPLL